MAAVSSVPWIERADGWYQVADYRRWVEQTYPYRIHYKPIWKWKRP